MHFREHEQLQSNVRERSFQAKTCSSRELKHWSWGNRLRSMLIIGVVAVAAGALADLYALNEVSPTMTTWFSSYGSAQLRAVGLGLLILPLSAPFLFLPFVLCGVSRSSLGLTLPQRP